MLLVGILISSPPGGDAWLVVFVPVTETKAAADKDSVPLLWPSLVLWINQVRSQQTEQQKFPAVSSFRIL